MISKVAPRMKGHTVLFVKYSNATYESKSDRIRKRTDKTLGVKISAKRFTGFGKGNAPLIEELLHDEVVSVTQGFDSVAAAVGRSLFELYQRDLRPPQKVVVECLGTKKREIVRPTEESVNNAIYSFNFDTEYYFPAGGFDYRVGRYIVGSDGRAEKITIEEKPDPNMRFSLFVPEARMVTVGGAGLFMKACKEGGRDVQQRLLEMASQLACENPEMTRAELERGVERIAVFYPSLDFEEPALDVSVEAPLQSVVELHVPEKNVMGSATAFFSKLRDVIEGAIKEAIPTLKNEFD